MNPNPNDDFLDINEQREEEIDDSVTQSKKLLLQVSQLSLYSGVGVLIRLTTLLISSNFPSSAIYCQMLGCFIMGMISVSCLGRYHYLRLGLATGLCGSLTSFSTFVFQVSSLLIHGSIWNGIMMIIYTISLSYTSYLAGRWMEKAPLPHPSFFWQRALSLLDDSIQVHIASASLQVSLVLWCVFDSSPTSRFYSVSMLLGPFGSISRFALSLIYNNDPLNFPMGTFLANILATGLLAILSTINTSSLSSMSCIWIASISAGFCGSLSTISTFIVELHVMETDKAFFYATWSITIGSLVSFVFNGITRFFYLSTNIFFTTPE